MRGQMVSTQQVTYRTRLGHCSYGFWHCLLLAMNIEVLRYHKRHIQMSNISFLNKALRTSTVYIFQEQLESLSNAHMSHFENKWISCMKTDISAAPGLPLTSDLEDGVSSLKGNSSLYIIKVIYLCTEALNQHQSAMYEKSLNKACSSFVRGRGSFGGVRIGRSVVNSSSKLLTSSGPFCK